MRTIEELAREAGLGSCMHVNAELESLERFAALVRAQAMEEAAVIAEKTLGVRLPWPDGPETVDGTRWFDPTPAMCAAAIRAEGVATT